MKTEKCIFIKLSKFDTVTILKCLSIGTPNINNFPFVPNGKLMVFKCPSIQPYSQTCLKGSPKGRTKVAALNR